ncbi:Fe(2+) transporter permease subunit FeoB [Thiomonas bhubaneswarensis]|uniref:Ferrous iron transport protein B n=1 Tax=Thiomonas bhubaneswarensis TaxID=339866 RepID=A0A0K6I5U3_9BURK|nr:Fe(2+) transporter permease subunit FeoB [Thiomonas bhubaneswarensis]CUA98428.1 ferrous iron transporter FeoB [Thiomonas bhubaneswarensis]
MSACHDSGCAPKTRHGQSGRQVVALAGNPNCGKTTIFNLLTGAHQHVGNWPGVTVERREGSASVGERKLSVVDLPGVYSLLGGGGVDQRVAREYLLGEEVDLVVNIVDASNLERHLALTAELLEVGKPMVLALNMIDEAQALGLEPQVQVLSERLGIPVVALVARKGRGRKELLQAIDTALSEGAVPQAPGYGAAVTQALETVAAALPGAQASMAARRIEALRLLQDLAEPPTAALQAVVRREQAAVESAEGEAAVDCIAAARFGWAHEVASAALQRRGEPGLRQRVTEVLDRVVLNEWLGVPIFLLVLYLVFVVSFSGGNIFLDFFDQASSALLIGGVGHVLLQLGLPDWVVQVVAGGVGGGLNLVIAFIPPIGLTFLFLALLDDSGYMARAAYAMDRFMRRMGLPGNALVPMVIGFGCNVPAIMGSRIIEDPRGRALTVLMQPFMSCSARLTIYMAFAVVFFRDNGGQVVFLLYVLGIVVALLTAWLLGRTAMKGEPMPFVMELPPYRLPSVRSVVLQSWQRLKVFIFRVGKVIAAIGLVLFILPGIGWTSQGLKTTDIDHSLLAQGSRALTPLFEPMGITRDNWPAVSGLIAGAAAKEVVIGTLNGIYQRQQAADAMETYRHPDVLNKLGAAVMTIPDNAKTFFSTLTDPLGLHDLSSAKDAETASGATNETLAGLAAAFTPLSAFAYLVFVLLYVPCASTMGALRREVGWGWMMFSIAYGIGLAWGAATVIYQVGTFAQHPLSSAGWIGGCLLAFALLVIGLRQYGNRGGLGSTSALEGASA